MSRFRDYAFDWVAWLFFASIPVLIFWQSATSLAEQGAASGGPLDNAAFYPRVIATLMSVVVAIQGARLILGRVSHRSPFTREGGTPLALAFSSVFVIYLIALPSWGFHLATPPLCIGMMWAMGVRPVPAFIGGLVLWFCASFVFEGLLNVVLPVGMFGLTIFN